MSGAGSAAIERSERIFDALGDGTRRAILRALAGGPQSVSALARPLGVTLTAVSQHLRILQSCGLLRTRKVGRVRICEVDERGLDMLEEWIALQRQAWAQRLDRLGEVLDDGEDGSA